VERAEKIGLGASATGHLLLLVALSLGLLARPRSLPDIHEAMDVELVSAIAPSAERKAVVPAAAAAPSPEEPAPAPPTSKLTAPPPPPPQPAPKPKAEPKPELKPAPAPKPEPETKPVPKPKPAPEKAKPEKPKPEKAKPEKAKPEKPKPEAKPKAETKALAKAEKAPAVTKAAPDHQRIGKDFLKGIDTSADKAAAAPGTGKTASAKPKSDRLGKDFLKGLSVDAKKDEGAPAAKISPLQLASIGAAIVAQIKPCYQVPSGGVDVSKIKTTLDLRFNKDGTLTSPPTLVDQSGVNSDNRAYAQQMAEAARRAVLRCAPLHLPAELYKGGWDHIQPTFTPASLD
jgi:outer membrane biosynthesis protein TonB